jgi:hypothetical protein
MNMPKHDADDRDNQEGQRPGSRRGLIIGLATLGSIVALVGALAAGGLLPGFGPQTAIPPCEDLPSTTDAVDALEQRPAFVAALETIGPEVEVRVENPCEGDERAVVTVYYQTHEQREAIHDVFNTSDGLGVPARVVQDDG